MTAAPKVKLNQGIGNGVPEAPTGRKSNIVTQVPAESNALIIKLVCDPTYDNGKKIYRPVRYFSHLVGNKESDRRDHACQTFFGERTSPENDAYWDAKKELSQLKKTGRGDSVEARKLEAVVKNLKPKNRGWLLFVEPGSPVVKALRVSETVLDRIVGKKPNDFNKDGVQSILDEMQSKGMSPFDLSSKTGWLKLYKTGDGINTRYHLETATVDAMAETKDGKKINYKEDVQAEVHPHILEDLDLSEFPNVVEFEKRNAFTFEESLKFVAVGGTIEGTPARLLKQEQPLREAGDDTEEVTELPSAGNFATVSEDEIPF